MSIMGAISLELIAHLHERTKNWTILPLTVRDSGLVFDYHYLIVQPPQPQQSYLELFYANPPQACAYLLIKIPRRHLRILQLSAEPHHVGDILISYWRAYGWKQTERIVKRSATRYIPEEEPNRAIYRLKTIIRISGGSRHRPSKIQRDRIYIQSPYHNEQLYTCIIQTILKSYDTTGLPRRSEYELDDLAVRFGGPNLEYNDFNAHWQDE